MAGTRVSNMNTATAEDIMAANRLWLEKAIIGLNLCPFAKAVHVREQIRYVVSEAETPEALLADLLAELRGWRRRTRGEIDTTLIIHPQVNEDIRAAPLSTVPPVPTQVH